jgi:hypothetical protein
MKICPSAIGKRSKENGANPGQHSCGVWGSGAARDVAASQFQVVYHTRPGLYPSSELHIFKRSKESQREAKGAAAVKPL